MTRKLKTMPPENRPDRDQGFSLIVTSFDFTHHGTLSSAYAERDRLRDLTGKDFKVLKILNVTGAMIANPDARLIVKGGDRPTARLASPDIFWNAADTEHGYTDADTLLKTFAEFSAEDESSGWLEIESAASLPTTLYAWARSPSGTILTDGPFSCPMIATAAESRLQQQAEAQEQTETEAVQ